MRPILTTTIGFAILAAGAAAGWLAQPWIDRQIEDASGFDAVALRSTALGEIVSADPVTAPDTLGRAAVEARSDLPDDAIAHRPQSAGTSSIDSETADAAMPVDPVRPSAAVDREGRAGDMRNLASRFAADPSETGGASAGALTQLAQNDGAAETSESEPVIAGSDEDQPPTAEDTALEAEEEQIDPARRIDDQAGSNRIPGQTAPEQTTPPQTASEQASTGQPSAEAMTEEERIAALPDDQRIETAPVPVIAPQFGTIDWSPSSLYCGFRPDEAGAADSYLFVSERHVDDQVSVERGYMRIDGLLRELALISQDADGEGETRSYRTLGDAPLDIRVRMDRVMTAADRAAGTWEKPPRLTYEGTITAMRGEEAVESAFSGTCG